MSEQNFDNFPSRAQSPEPRAGVEVGIVPVDGDEESPKVELAYTVTNENIEAVLAGFEMSTSGQQGKVLAIGGSGDIPFALLPFVQQIDVVDSNPAQIAFIRQRIEQLRTGEYEAFLNPDVSGKHDGRQVYQVHHKAMRDRYFLQHSKLDEMRGSLDKMHVLDAADLFVLDTTALYSRIYASNTIGLLGRGERIGEDLFGLQQKLEKGGFLYAANGDYIDARVGEGTSTLPEGLTRSPLNTEHARSHNKSVSGQPTIYRKW